MNRAIRILTALGLLLCGLGQARADMFSYTGTIQTYTVPTTGLYDITAAGAQGGSGDDTNSIGGLGAVLSGEISLTAGTTLQIVVGGQGLTGNFGDRFGGGGGGGSFVFVSGPPGQPLLVAGGGGGAAYTGFDSITNGGSGQTGTAGQNGFGTFGGAGGTNGSGGDGGSNTSGNGENGGGGAGWFGNGGNGFGFGPNSGVNGSGDGGFGPPTFAGGLGDGTQARPGGQYADGGFGGGGGGGFQGGGGGGGYSGGGGGDGGTGSFDTEGAGGGGGGSYFDPSFTILSENSGAQSEDGFVSIAPAAVSTPEPCSLILLGMGGVGFAVYGWQRRKQAVPA